jgi:hypothetical protein
VDSWLRAARSKTSARYVRRRPGVSSHHDRSSLPRPHGGSGRTHDGIHQWADTASQFSQIIDYNLAVNRDHRAGLQTEDGAIYVIDEDSAEIIFTYETP